MIVRRSAEVVALLALVVAATGLQSQPPLSSVSLPEATVTVYGRPGSFGALGETLPSGQPVAKAGVPGWAFPAGRLPNRVVQAGDTLLMASSDAANLPVPGSGDLFAAAFDLTAKRLSTISIPTTRGKTSVWRDGHTIAPAISDLLVLDDKTVLYTAWPTQLYQDATKDGVWPVLGLLTKVDGQWKAGPSWTGGSLRAAGWEKACPPVEPAVQATQPVDSRQSECRALGKMARLKSGDIVVTQANGFLIINVARDGLAELKAQYDFPEGAGSPSSLAVHPVEDRFVIGLKVEGGLPVIQEFKWDKDSRAVTPISGRLLPGDKGKGYGPAIYDSFGNLWVGRWNGVVTGGPMAVFTRARCAPAVQAVVCKPDYDILQTNNYAAAEALVLDPVTNTVVYLAHYGVMQAMRFNGRDFTMSNPVDLADKLLLGPPGSSVEHGAGVVIGSRVWLTGLQHQPGIVGAPFDQWLYSIDLSELFTPAPQLLSSAPSWPSTLQIGRTTETGTTLMPGEAGVKKVVSKAAFGVCSDIPAGSACANDQQAGNGFYLRSDVTWLGWFEGSAGYPVKVLEPGSYRVSARVFVFYGVNDAVLEINVAGQRARIVIPPNPTYAWRNIAADVPIMLPAGVHSVTIGSQPDEIGWSASSITWQRV